MAAGDGRPGLPAFQLEVARMFFALPASRGFLLAGGAALLAQHLTARPTEDLDFFTAPERGHVPAARDALEAAARQAPFYQAMYSTTARFASARVSPRSRTNSSTPSARAA
jgi:Nucleotidyl transferase AbiEii toxin, Type IV TA system